MFFKKPRRSRTAVVGVCCALTGAAVVPVISLAGSITGSTGDGPMVLQSGEATPTYVGAKNVSSLPTHGFKQFWSRVGDTVTVTGSFPVKPTAVAGVGTGTGAYIPLPVDSNLTGAPDCAGTATVNYDSGGPYSAGQVIGASDGSDRCYVEYAATSTANNWIHYSLQYRVED